METSEALREHVAARVTDLTTYFDQVTDVNVKFVADAHHKNIHSADITMHANGLILRAEGSNGDWYGAVDAAMAKLQKQLKKYKGKLEQRKNVRKQFKEQVRDLGPLAFEDNSMDGLDVEGLEGQFKEFAPDIAKKEVTRIAPMTVDEAVMQMDLLHKPAFLFMNVDTKELNMVYREGENSIRWVAPKMAA